MTDQERQIVERVLNQPVCENFERRLAGIAMREAERADAADAKLRLAGQVCDILAKEHP